jgi:hypothetical protein
MQSQMSQSDDMAFGEDGDEDSKFVLIRKDPSVLNGPVRQLSNVPDFDERAGCCFGAFGSKKDKYDKRQHSINTLQ